MSWLLFCSQIFMFVSRTWMWRDSFSDVTAGTFYLAVFFPNQFEVFSFVLFACRRITHRTYTHAHNEALKVYLVFMRSFWNFAEKGHAESRQFYFSYLKGPKHLFLAYLKISKLFSYKAVLTSIHPSIRCSFWPFMLPSIYGSIYLSTPSVSMLLSFCLITHQSILSVLFLQHSRFLL